MDLSKFIRDVPDFPKPGIVFKDITPLLASPDAFRHVIDAWAARHARTGVAKVLGIESRGFIFGVPLAARLGVGFIPARKPKKLPYKTIRAEYALEYGTDALEIHIDAVAKGEKVLLVDDLLATGGTAAAACRLVEELGGTVVESLFVIELGFLKARESNMKNREIHSLLTY